MNKELGKDFTSASGDDNVFTPYSMTTQLLENEHFDYNGTILEPACGELHMVKVLNKYFTKGCDYYDLYKREYENFNFLEHANIYDCIITNPPYSQLDKFIVKAKQIATIKFAFLCKLTHLGGIKRLLNGTFTDSKYPLTKIHLFVRQANLRFTNDYQENVKNYIPYRAIREDGKYPAGMYYYCWMVWEKRTKYNKNTIDNMNKPIFNWIDNHKYILSRSEA